jgi:hypothetical protein
MIHGRLKAVLPPNVRSKSGLYYFQLNYIKIFLYLYMNEKLFMAFNDKKWASFMEAHWLWIVEEPPRHRMSATGRYGLY